LTSSNFVDALRSLLNKGTIGLWSALALLAAIILIFRKSKSDNFLIFAGVIAVIAAGLEILRAYDETSQRNTDRIFWQNQALPEQLWDSFFEARGNVEMNGAKTLPQPEFPYNAGKSILAGETISKNVSLNKFKCGDYLVAMRPPATLNIAVEGNGIESREGLDKNYYRTGRICAPENIPDRHAVIKITAEGAPSQFRSHSSSPRQRLRFWVLGPRLPRKNHTRLRAQLLRYPWHRRNLRKPFASESFEVAAKGQTISGSAAEHLPKTH
jgi:hypothetical protein